MNDFNKSTEKIVSDFIQHSISFATDHDLEYPRVFVIDIPHHCLDNPNLEGSKNEKTTKNEMDDVKHRNGDDLHDIQTTKYFRGYK